MRLPLTLALALAAVSANAVETRVPELGSETIERARSRTEMVPEAGRASWDAFRAKHPGPWRAEWDSRAGTARQIWGASFELVVPDAPAAQVEAAVRAELAPLARVPLAWLRTSTLERRGDTWYVRFDRVTRDGTPVAGAYAEARVTRGRLVLLRIETHPGAESSLVPAKLGRASAIAAAEREIRSRRTVVQSDATLVLAPIAAGDRYAYRPAFEVVSRASTREVWRTRVDAVHGEVLSRSLLTPSLEAQLTATVEPRTVGDPLVAVPLPHVLTESGGTSVTSSDGRFTYPGTGPVSVSASLSGPFITTLHSTLPEGSATFSISDGATHTWTAPGDSTQVEIAGFVHASTARAWALRQAPANDWLQTNVEVHVGVAGECNAIYDGTLLLFGEGATCNDTGRIADVVYHEYGHGFHQHVRVGGIIDGAVGEGIGDYVSATLTNSPRIGLGLYKNSGDDGALRDIEEDLIYPDDLTGQVHNDGLVFSGAMWDTRKAFIAALGTSAGTIAADALFTKLVEAGPTLDLAFVDVLLADDDDADLSNGTPNLCLLEVAFGLHGLTGASGLFSLTHSEPSGEIASGEPIAISAMRPAAASLCAETQISSATLHWFVPGGDSGDVALTLSGETFSGAIPAQASGDVVRYWFDSQLQTGDAVLTPPRAPDNTFAFHVGPLEVIWLDDFETAAGWTSGGSQDDWQIGAPQGLGGDPASAFSGTNVLGNTLDGDGHYLPGAASFIESPAIDCGACDGARLVFRRWGRVQQAISDRVSVQVNGVPVWQNEQGITFEELTVDDPIWSYQQYDISELADGGANVRIRFTLESDIFLEYGGLTIDDVAIVMPPSNGGGGGGGRGCGCAIDGARASPPFMLLGLAFVAVFVRRRRAS